jgi:hypothetical protein
MVQVIFYTSFKPILVTWYRESFPNLQQILTRPTNWYLIRQQYDQMVKYTIALRLSTAEDFRALTPFIYTHTNPYDNFDLDMGERIPIDA